MQLPAPSHKIFAEIFVVMCGHVCSCFPFVIAHKKLNATASAFTQNIRRNIRRDVWARVLMLPLRHSP